MNEHILKSIIQLLALVAKEDDYTKEEKNEIYRYLSSNLSKEDVEYYMDFFNNLILIKYTDEEAEHKIIYICKEINNDQTLFQKVIIVLKLLEIIASDGFISLREDKIVAFIAKELHINKYHTELIKSYVVNHDVSKLNSEQILLIQEDLKFKNCKFLRINRLDGVIVILKIPNMDIYFIKLEGDDEVILNGEIMKEHYVYVFSQGSVIKSEGNLPIFQCDIAGCFRMDKVTEPLSFVASDIKYEFKNGKIGLQKINIAEEAGRLIAIMGGSGSGKSTLLEVLNGNYEPTRGAIRINSIDINLDKRKIDGVIGYVPQDDLLVEELTVFENLYFGAKLCFSDKYDKQLKHDVDNILDSLGLSDIKHLKVGSALEKSISGGQRKRLNIGLELLKKPSVFFVDEPTSGLSSRDSENIMDLLKGLAFEGKIIFVVIHQPSEEVFKMFDKLILLDKGGYQIYYGNPIEAISYFKELTSIVDKQKNNNPELLFNIIESKVVNEFGILTNKRKISAEEWNIYFNKNTQPICIKEVRNPPNQTIKIPSKVKQFLIYIHRDLLTKLNNKQYLSINLLEAPILAVVLGLITFYIPEDTDSYSFKENQNIPVFFFMSIIVALFMGLTVSAEELIRDRKLLKKEAFLNLSRSGYLASKFAVLFSLSAIQTLLFVLLGCLILKIQGITFSFWLVLFSVSCFANTLGLILSSIFNSSITVYVVIPLIIIPQLILSGVVINFDKLNPIITKKDRVPLIGEIMASRWAYEAIMVNQFVNNKYEKNFFTYDKIMAQSEFKTVYLIPRLISELRLVRDYIEMSNPFELEKAASGLETLRNEIKKELSLIADAKFEELDSLYLERFTKQTFLATEHFLTVLKNYYNLRYHETEVKRREKSLELTNSNDHISNIAIFRSKHENEALSALVKNTITKYRILENNNELVQKIYPVFMEPNFPKHVFDFRAQFYSSYKYLFGFQIFTLIFNVVVIWLMTFLLMFTLYFDLLNKLLNNFRKK